MNKILKGFQKRVLKFINHRFLHHLNGVLMSKSRTLDSPPIFIIGAPRSGSTLLMQLLTSAFDFSYFTNAHALFFGFPELVEAFLYLSKKKQPTSTYSSTHGKVDGLLAPSECGEFWYRFFPRNPSFSPLSSVKKSRMLQLRHSIATFSKIRKKSLLFKNMLVALRLEAIIEYFPEALFIVIERDEIDNAFSLLTARDRICGDYDKWWSMEPPNIEHLKELPPAQQVIEQIREIYKLIESDFEKSNIRESRVLYVKYEELCKDVHSTISIIQSFFIKNNIDVTEVNEVPHSFNVRKRYSIPLELQAEVRKYAQDD